MSSIIESPAKCEVRSVIRFLHAKKLNAAEIHRQICEVYGPNIMSDSAVRRWCREFSEGRTNVHDEDRSGRPSLLTNELVELVNQKVREIRRFSISQLSEVFPQISRTILYEIVSEKLQYHKVCARWVPKMLTDDHKNQRVASAEKFLTRYQAEGVEFLNHIVTGDETWIAYVNPETKRQSMQWMHSTSPKPKKFKQTFSGRKLMATVFWDHKGVLLIEFLPRGRTITSLVYCETLKKLRRAIQNKRRGLLSSGIVFLHDNARPHTATATREIIEKFKWEIFDHPPYSPDLAPSDFHLFMHLKNFLASQKFTNDDDLKTAVEGWLNKQAATFFEEGIKKLVPRYEKCKNSGGDYVEK